MPTTILVVEDNPITRKLVRFTLEHEGLTVVEAPDAASALDAFSQAGIALVLQDLCLPDMDGFELVSRLRALPGGAEIPILVFSGMLSPHDEARISSAGFDDLVTKPVEPTRLVQIVRTHLPAPDAAPPDLLGQGRRLVVADDDPVQRKLVGFRLQRLGFEVSSAADGNEALELARRARPHAVLSDVLMPGLDGFGLCLELKRDPELAKVPIVLTTNSYVEPTDRDLARKAGAHDLVLRTPDLRDVLSALRASLTARPAVLQSSAATAEFEAEHMRRMMRQLERQVALNARISQRSAVLSAEMSVLRGISEALAIDEDIDDAVRNALAACFDAGGISLGALYLREDGALRVLRFGFSRDWSEGDLLDFFGERALLDAAIGSQRSTIVLPGGAEGRQLLARTGASSALIVPVAYRGEAFGALVLLGRGDEQPGDDRIKFAEAMAGQISQAVAVAKAFREKERSERAASEQAAILRSVLESLGDGVGVVDGDGRLILSNSAARDIVGLGLRPTNSMDSSIKIGLFESDTLTPMPFDRLPLVRAMRGEAIDGVELFARHENAPEGIWLSATGRPWRDDQGVSRGGVVVFRDVTREKAAQSQLMVSDRMASVGMLAAGVAHEINNPLACVLANLDLSLRQLAERADAGDAGDVQALREMLDDSRVAADRVRQIVRDLKIFSRHEETRTGAVDIQKVIESSVRMAWNEIRHRARLVKDYGNVAPAEGSESRLGQVFLNLIVNAAQAVPEGNAEGHTIRIVTRPDPSGQIVVEISDTGAGISPENRRHLFSPFFTTKGPGVGTGLGLAICHRIITGLGGEIQVESEPGKGTTFRVILPAARSVDLVVQEPTPRAAAAARRARILVIDDEAMVAAAIRRTLSSEHEVLTNLAAGEALERIRSGEAFDLILCDLMMPQMTGMEFHAELRKLGTAYAERVIFLTGGAFTPAARAFLDEVSNQRVEKPFDAQHLWALVNDRLR